MRTNMYRSFCALAVILLAMMACNLGTPQEAATETPGMSPTSQEEASVTEASPETPTPTLELATATLTLEPSLTPTAGNPVADVQREVNCRTGPGGMYDLVLTFKAGDQVEIVARDLGAGFVYVRNPNEPDQGCWILENSLKVSGDLTALPAFTPRATPTLAPNFTVKYKNFDNCKGVFLRFIIVNTGGFGFRSAYVKVTNLKNNEVTEQVVNAFDLTTGCIVAQNIAPLGPGATGYLQSDLFKKDPKGQKMRAVFQVCTEQNLKGACATTTLDFVAK